MRLDMEILSPTSYFSNSSWLIEESKSTAKWTPAENKAFENALAVFDESTPDRWHRVAEMVPGKTVYDVIRQYKELEDDVSSIEAGLIPVPGYTTSPSPSPPQSSSSSPFTLEWGGAVHTGFDGFKQSYIISGGGRKSSARPSEQERKKGVPWTEEEHKLFLLGLKKYGKGDWRNISRNFVISRTPTQVASHAQKYFIRQLSGGKDKRRASIHDITTVNITDDQMSSPENKRVPSPEESNSGGGAARDLPFQTNNGTILGGFGSQCLGNIFASQPNFGTNSYGYESYMESQNMVFQMQSGFQYPNA